MALAVWPTDAALPGPVSRSARVPDIDRRPARSAPELAPRRPSPAAVVEPVRSILEADPAKLRERLRNGGTIAEIAAEFGVPWAIARRWIRGTGR